MEFPRLNLIVEVSGKIALFSISLNTHLGRKRDFVLKSGEKRDKSIYDSPT